MINPSQNLKTNRTLSLSAISKYLETYHPFYNTLNKQPVKIAWGPDWISEYVDEQTIEATAESARDIQVPRPREGRPKVQPVQRLPCLAF